MQARKYYSLRKEGPQNILLDTLKEMVFSVWQSFSDRGYFQEYLGIFCTDGHIPGKAGENLEGYILLHLRKANLWPFADKYKQYTEEDLFDMIEFFFDHASAPVDKTPYYHSWGNCGYHYNYFENIGLGSLEFREEINHFLADYGSGYELSAEGEILSLLPSNLRQLIDLEAPTKDTTISRKMDHAAKKFRKYGSTIEEREEAVRVLVDCFEFLRPRIKVVLSDKDDDDLFNIANNFGIRHTNQRQKTNYNKEIWLEWMFYFYYATLVTCLRIVKETGPEEM